MENQEEKAFEEGYDQGSYELLLTLGEFLGWQLAKHVKTKHLHVNTQSQSYLYNIISQVKDIVEKAAKQEFASN
jgi:hypothetical protein